jgi:hypothetical protein
MIPAWARDSFLPILTGHYFCGPMNMTTRLLVAICAMAGLSSCSLMQEWGILSPKLKVIEEREFTIGTKTYISTRYLIRATPYETKLVVLEKTESWAR